MKKNKNREELQLENEKLKDQLAEAEETLRAIRSGEVDALVVSGEKGEQQVFTLKGAEQPYRILIEEMREGAAMLTADDYILYCNSGFASMLKMPLEKLIGTGIAYYIAPADEALFRELLRQGRERSSTGEITLLAGDGTFVPAHLSFNTLQMDGAQVIYLVATDLTEQKWIQDELRRARDELEIRVVERTKELAKSEQRWATTLASIGDAVISTDAGGRITFMNAVAEALTGWTFAEASTKPITEVFNIINEFTRAEIENPVSKVLQEGVIVGLANHTILVRKDGTEVSIDDSGAPIRDGNGKTMGVVLIFRDITERRRAEEALQESEARFRSVLDNSRDSIYRLNVQTGRYEYISPSTETIVGFSPDELMAMDAETSLTMVHPDDLPAMQAELARIENTGKGELEYRQMAKSGDYRWISNHISLIKDSASRPLYRNGNIRDITESKRAEEALRKAHDELELRVQERTAELKEANKALIESEASYRELTESIDDLFYAMDSDLRYTYWNKASEDLTGILAEDAIGKSIYELFPDVKGTKLERIYNEVLKTQQPERFESEYKLGDKKFIFEINAYPTKIGISVIAKDISEKKKLEAQLLRTQRMESIGTLASGIAHDLNNVLTPMMMSLHLLKEKHKDEQSQKLYNILEKNSERGANLIKQVLSFARGVEGERKPLQIMNHISEIEKILKETLPRNIEIRTDIQKDLFTISGDATQLHQVIMNLCVNARDAMPDGGILDITASNFFIDENHAQMHTEAKVGPYVVVAVSDTGTGIPPEIVDRIFEPFFTTKEFGKGTGLGLPTALAIVKSHGGFINVYSEVGKGTTFRVYLPSIKTELQNVKEEQFELPIGQGELVLVAEDEDSIREVTVSTLEAYGYKVLTANDGADAVALYAQNKDKIEVILMDMMMPVMDGHASIKVIRKINPVVKIITVSGLAEKDKLAKIADTGVHAFLPKPYTAERLLKTIHEVIGTE
jgi:two-component system cell cycle sensor histidine kinase/response regulator CckA